MPAILKHPIIPRLILLFALRDTNQGANKGFSMTIVFGDLCCSLALCRLVLSEAGGNVQETFSLFYKGQLIDTLNHSGLNVRIILRRIVLITLALASDGLC